MVIQDNCSFPDGIQILTFPDLPTYGFSPLSNCWCCQKYTLRLRKNVVSNFLR